MVSMVRVPARSGGAVDPKPKGNWHDRKWNDRYDELKDFKANHHHCNVPYRHETLGRWVSKQRAARKNAKLSEDRVKKLDALGLEWNPQGDRHDPRPRGNRHDQKWNDRCSELEAFRAKHRHCNVPQSQKPLGTWVNRQRQRKGKLSEGRIQKLDALGFDWSLRSTLPTWDERLKELVEYKREHGDCNVATREGSLGTWVNGQRQLQKKGKLSEERVQKLGKLGFQWSPRSTLPTWENRFDELTEYKSEHGHCNVPFRQGSLGRWVKTQRFNYKRSKLSEGRAQKLGTLGLDWSPGS
ncbi:hypothetical protein THAOC_35813 [Thalassiosira oceanica]|uniref:Helicase-associated domain-containing protein n=1 Tax=Thalassiosira oceanica TaxID=159749 RepID=K0R0B5_THAOC|nr:hypothetical protein THAOC_35813 [Thalassiosira oceanica]|eukprot:EJK45568.1 hypothetical protein THAOC_35813 [Thalassiosira oceanica]